MKVWKSGVDCYFSFLLLLVVAVRSASFCRWRWIWYKCGRKIPLMVIRLFVGVIVGPCQDGIGLGEIQVLPLCALILSRTVTSSDWLRASAEVRWAQSAAFIEEEV